MGRKIDLAFIADCLEAFTNELDIKYEDEWTHGYDSALLKTAVSLISSVERNAEFAEYFEKYVEDSEEE